MISVHDLAAALKKQCSARKHEKVVVGLSGGVDSALTACIAVQALGADAVTSLSMPSEVTSEKSLQLANKQAQALGISTFSFSIEAALSAFSSTSWEKNTIADQQLSPRLRMTALYHYARSVGALVLGTSNKTELLLGYGTKWGDCACDISVLGALYKTEVYALAEHSGVLPEICARPPTAELFLGQKDADELGADYAAIDPILKRLVAAHGIPAENATTLEVSLSQRMAQNLHKTQPVPVLCLDA